MRKGKHMIRKSMVIKRKPIKVPSVDYKGILLLSLFICGGIIGALVIKNSDKTVITGLKLFLESYLGARTANNFFGCFCGSLLIALTVPLVLFFSGLSVIGVPIAFMVMPIIGLVSGGVSAFYYCTYAMPGLGYCSLVIIPAFAIVCGTLIKCAEKSAEMSVGIIGAISGKNNEKYEKDRLAVYCKSYLVYLVPIILASALNAGSFKIFSGLFSFI